MREEASFAFSGPMPPQMLAAYEEILEGSADRILRQVEENGKHRRRLESAVVGADLRLESRGQWFAFLLALTALAGGIGLIAFGKPIAGASIAIIAVGPLAGMFVWTKRKEGRGAARGLAVNQESVLGDMHRRNNQAGPLPGRGGGGSG